MQDEGVRRLLLYFLAWAVTAAAIVGGSWFGINGALGAAVPTRVAPLSLTDLRSAVPPSSPGSVPSHSPSGSSSPSVTGSPSVTPSEADSWRPSPDSRGGSGYTRTFHTVGGDAVLFASHSEAKVVDAVPHAGWTATVRQNWTETATVTFTSQSQRNRYVRLTVSWSDGPVVEYSQTLVMLS